MSAKHVWRGVFAGALFGCLTLISKADPTSAAWALYDAGDYAGAQSAFTELFRQAPDQVEVLYGLGLSALKGGHYSRAAFMLNRALEIAPDHHRARLELARAYFALGLHSLARQNFEQVLQSNPPAPVRHNIDAFLVQIRQEERRWDAGGEIQLSLFYDDNVNFGPSSSTIDTRIGTLRVSDASQSESAWGTAVGVQTRAALDIGQLRHWMATAGLSLYGNRLSSSREQELYYGRAQLGLRHVNTTSQVDLPLKVEFLGLDQSSFLVISGLEPSLVWAVRPDKQFYLTGQAEWRDYQKNAAQSGPFYRISPSFRYAPGSDPRDALTLSAGAFFEDADGPAERNSGADASLLAEIGLPGGVMAYGLSAFRSVQFDDPLFVGLQSQAREDEQWQFSGGLRRAFASRYSVDANVRHIQNNSNFGLYEYHRNIFTLTTSMRF